METKTVKKTRNAIRGIEETDADVEVRIARRVEVGTIIQQGDVYVTRMPDDHPRGKRLRTQQVAVGTNIGARHVAEGESVEVFAGKKLPEGASVPEWATENDMLGPVVVARGPWTLTHPEHAHHALPAGVYQVTFQLDYSTRRRVVD